MSTPARLANWNAAHPPPGTITTAGLQRAPGLSYRQIDYWCRMGWLPTLTEEGGGSGYARMFDERLVPAVRLAVRARALGAPVADACAPIVFWARFENVERAAWLLLPGGDAVLDWTSHSPDGWRLGARP
mgnify:CR=1 FL=1